MAETRSHSQILQARMELTCGRLHTAYRRFWTDPSLDRRVAGFFLLMHQIVRASVPLLNAARTVAMERSATDEICRHLVPYYSRHAADEQHHDEWLLQDLESAGIDRERVFAAIPLASVASLVGAQYYWIHHHHPVSLLGYMRVLEGNPPSPDHLQRLEQIPGLAPSMLRTYRLHGQLDPHHREEMDRFVDSLPLSAVHHDLVWISGSHTAHALADCLQQIGPTVRRQIVDDGARTVSTSKARQ